MVKLHPIFQHNRICQIVAIQDIETGLLIEKNIEFNAEIPL